MRIFSIAASAALAAMTAIAPASAHEPERKSNIIIKRIGEDGKPIRLEHGRVAEMLAHCRGKEKAESDVTSGEGKEKFRTRVVICGKGDSAENRAKLAEALEKARAELSAHEGMSPERRAEAAAALDREIARLRAQTNK